MLSRFCEYCGKDIKKSDVFCPVCGSNPVAAYPVSLKTTNSVQPERKSVA